MKSFKDKGYILKVRDFGEADKLVIALTENYGRVEAIARGASKITSRKRGSLDLLNLVKFAFHEGSTLDIITEAELVEDFEPIKHDLYSISEIFYLLELIDRLAFGSDEEANVFFLLEQFLEKAKANWSNHELLVRGLELKLLSIAGFGPELTTCIHCGQLLKEASPRISAASGQAGYLCDKHFSALEYNLYLVEDRILKLQKFALLEDFNVISRIKTDKQLNSRLRSIQKSWIEGVLERKLNSVSLIDHLQHKHEK